MVFHDLSLLASGKDFMKSNNKICSWILRFSHSGALRTDQALVSTKLTFRGYRTDHVLVGCIGHTVCGSKVNCTASQKWLLQWLKRQVEDAARKTVPEGRRLIEGGLYSRKYGMWVKGQLHCRVSRNGYFKWLKRQVEDAARKTAPEAYLTDIQRFFVM